MTIVDWRTLSTRELARCYEVERAAWSNRFHWETADTWLRLEAARSAGALPGLVAYDGSRPVGWCFFLRHRGTIQIGGLSAGAARTVDALLDAMLASPDVAGAEDVMAFVPEMGAPMQPSLRQRAFEVRPFQYLVVALRPGTATEYACRSYHAGRLTAIADLLARAYPGADRARPFAPHGSPAAWMEYTSQLLTQTGCGALLPWASVVEEAPDRPGRLIGAVLTTAIERGTGHIAQIAVDAAYQGQGIGSRLLRTALTRLRQRGFSRATLLVSSSNATALKLYTRLGFERRGAFLSAWRAA
ncbi:MAG: GNAT family N-acetyltransferase [Vicinamibacterales bacterium]